MRILHMLDAFCYGGDSYFATVQGGSNEVHEGYDGDVLQVLLCLIRKLHAELFGLGGEDGARALIQPFLDEVSLPRLFFQLNKLQPNPIFFPVTNFK